MNNYGFVRVAAAAPDVRVADCDYNTNEIIKIAEDACKKGVSIIVFPESCITSYSAQDLFRQRLLLNESLHSIEKIRSHFSDTNITIIVGIPLEVSNRLYNVAVVIEGGKIIGIVPKTYLPNYGEFHDMRWYSSSRELEELTIEICGQTIPIGTNLIFKTSDTSFAIELCEDLWTAIPPSSFHTLNGAEIIFNLSASSETADKNTYRKELIRHQSARCIAGYVYASAGNGESTTDVVFSGSCLIAENDSLLAESEQFSFESQLIVSDIDVERLRHDRLKNTSFTKSEYRNIHKAEYRTIPIDTKKEKGTEFKLERWIDPTPLVPTADILDARCSTILSIQIGGLAKRLLHTNIKNSIIGVSGGLDSTLALLVLAKAYDKLNIPRKNIIGITMPGFGTTNRTYKNAISLMQSLDITIKEVSIKESVIQHFKDIEHDINVHDTTYENAQARERTQILMDYANKVNGLVIGTGDMSELALGWCTYNGDQMSMYGLNAGVPKTLVKKLVEWMTAGQFSRETEDILKDIFSTPVSPELLPTNKDGETTQMTEDSVGPYILHDFFLYYMMRFGFEPKKIYYLAKHAFEGKYTNEIILKWLKVFYRRFFTQQFKRSCMPDGPKIGSINLSPRGDWRMVSDASYALWIKQLENLD